MAPFGKLYTFKGGPRSTSLEVLAKINNLEIELIPTSAAKPETITEEYKKLNRLGRVPTFQGTDGYVLHEVIAVAVYFTSQNDKTTLLGKTKQDYASILKWMSFVNMDVAWALGAWYRPLLGHDPYNKKSVLDGIASSEKALSVLEDHLLINTYLVGERLTLADIFTASFIGRAMTVVLDKQWREKHPNITRWALTILNQPDYKSVAGEPQLVETGLKNEPPQKKEAAAAPKQEKAKAKAKEPEEEEEEPPQPKPAKHPLEALGKAAVPIDDWKRKYKNAKDTRGEAMPWFWQELNWEEYSVWQIDFKYNEELTMTFMSANQVGGLFNRLEASRKFIMGVANVYGVTNDSVIKGAFLVRGQDYLPAFDVAPDYESYAFTKLDPKSETDREFVGSVFAQDKPVEVNGKAYEWADGKIYV